MRVTRQIVRVVGTVDRQQAYARIATLRRNSALRLRLASRGRAISKNFGLSPYWPVYLDHLCLWLLVGNGRRGCLKPIFSGAARKRGVRPCGLQQAGNARTPMASLRSKLRVKMHPAHAPRTLVSGSTTTGSGEACPSRRSPEPRRRPAASRREGCAQSSMQPVATRQRRSSKCRNSVLRPSGGEAGDQSAGCSETCSAGGFASSRTSSKAGRWLTSRTRSCVPTSSRTARVPASPSRGLASRRTRV